MNVSRATIPEAHELSHDADYFVVQGMTTYGTRELVESGLEEFLWHDGKTDGAAVAQHVGRQRQQGAVVVRRRLINPAAQTSNK